VYVTNITQTRSSEINIELIYTNGSYNIEDATGKWPACNPAATARSYNQCTGDCYVIVQLV